MNMFTCYGVASFTFCHLLRSRCLFFGDVSSKRDPSAYLNYIFSIYDYYQKEYYTLAKREKSSRTVVPLVVNTPGWVKGKLVSFELLI